jgi:hypothetical protein
VLLLVVVVVVVVLLGLVCLAAYYQQETYNYWRLQGWNPGAAKDAMERFAQEAHDGQTSAGDFLDPAWCQPVIEGGKFVGVRHPGPVGPTVTRVEKFLPDAKVTDCHVRIKNKSGVYQVDLQFPNGKWASLDVDRVHGALRIRSVPDALSSTQPHVEPWD